jgi:type II secretory pathway component GspD/PulD (secretin)
MVKPLAGIVLVLALAPMAQATVVPPGLLGTALSLGQVPEPNASAHSVLNSAIDCYRSGDYERAAVLLQRAQVNQAELTPDEVTDLNNHLRRNNQALKARADGSSQLLKAVQALDAGKKAEAVAILKSLSANQYLAANDRQLAQKLSARLRSSPGAALPGEGPELGTATSPANPAQLKLLEARKLLGDGNYQAAMDKALEAERLGGTYMIGDDTPQRVLTDVEKARHGTTAKAPTALKAPVAKPDAKTLLTSARAALQKGDLDQAEALATEADKAAAQSRGVLPGWMHPWSDNPAKVRRDIQAARAKQASAQAAQAPKKKTAEMKANRTDDKNVDLVAAHMAASGTDAGTTKPENRAGASPADKTAAARKLIQEGRKALKEENLALARQKAELARDLKPDLRYWEDNPKNLMIDIRRKEAQLAKKPVQPDKKAATVAPVAAKAPADKDKRLTPAEARVALKQARQAYTQNMLDEAERLGRQAADAKSRWGLFEDSPEKLRVDIRNARGKRDREISVKLLAEARALYAKGDLAEARKRAYQAQKLHGSYSWWDLSDRPQSLITEIEVAQAKSRRNRGPEAGAGADKKETADSGDMLADKRPSASVLEDKRPSASVLEEKRPSTSQNAASPVLLTAEERTARAGDYLAEARVQLARNNFQLAKEYTAKVEQLGAGWDANAKGPPPWTHSLSVVEQEIQQASYQAEAIVPPSGTPLVGAATPAQRQVAHELAKQKAKMLVAEARALQGKGRLVEARQKALEAQRTSSAFGPEEDRPEIVLLHLSRLCEQRIEMLFKQAEDFVQADAGNPAQLRKAEANLQEAKQLAHGFGMDMFRVEHKIAWLQRVQDNMQARGPLPVGPQVLPAPGSDVVKAAVKETGTDPVTLKQQGEDLLNKSRLELRAGQTNQARRLAETVFTGPYGLRKESESMLRTIDDEEFKQSLLEASRTADAVISAFNRHDYAHAARICAAIDLRQLSASKQARLREIMMTPEMQAVTSTGRAPALVASKNDGQGPLPLQPVTREGKATATDDIAPVLNPSQEDLLGKTAGMQEIKFQELTAESHRVQKEAMERFKAGDHDRAIQMLRDFSAGLGGSDLESSRVDLLKRPVEDRLQKLTLLKAQGEFERTQRAGKINADNQMSKLAQAEKHKQDQVTDLMKKYHTLYREGKYIEAQATAQQVLEVDPDNVAASAGFQLAKTQSRLKDFHEISSEKEEYVLRALNDTDREGPSVVDDPLKFNQKIWERAKKRGKGYPEGIPGVVRSLTERNIERRLLAPISLNFKDTRLDDAIATLHDISGVNVVADKAALEDASVALDKQLTLQVENISLKSALNLLLEQLHLTYVVKNEVLYITTDDKAQGKLKRVTYPVADLVVPVENHKLAASADINNFFNRSYEAGAANPYAASPYPGPYSLQAGTPVSSQSSGTYVPPGATGQTPGTSVRNNGTGHTIEDTLIKLITSTIAPQTWTDVGGQGTIQYFPLGMALIVNQTQDLQEQISDLLAALRRLQDLEVAIEMRLVSVSESFFERIGLDFNVNIVNSNHKFDNNLLNGQFQPFGFINKFTPHGFVSGLTPAGTLTPDLGIPLQNNSFNLTTPPFGYPGLLTGDGGLSLGLAFLSDIQVFMFMEAAQGDRRFNIMQAPKLTMFNGQSATLTVADYQFFLTSVLPGFTPNGELYFIPNNVPAPLGVALAVQPVVSADRRFVRMNLNPTLTNLTNANVPITLGPQPQQQIGAQFPIASVPVQIPIPSVYSGGVVGPNQGGFLQVFLQQPTTTNIAIATTVSVPDGGTVLLGGLKTLSEGRSEFGPPIFSKIPYLNRLFKNVGYGREAQSLLIMVTPRIIINEEEEIRQTGGVGGVAGVGAGGQ